MQRNPQLRCARAKRDDELIPHIQRVWNANLQVYGADKIHRLAPWKTKESVELATLEWVSWFNHHRLLEPIGYIPLAEAEVNYYRQLAEKANAEALT